MDHEREIMLLSESSLEAETVGLRLFLLACSQNIQKVIIQSTLPYRNDLISMSQEEILQLLHHLVDLLSTHILSSLRMDADRRGESLRIPESEVDRLSRSDRITADLYGSCDSSSPHIIDDRVDTREDRIPVAVRVSIVEHRIR